MKVIEVRLVVVHRHGNCVQTKAPDATTFQTWTEIEKAITGKVCDDSPFTISAG